MRRGMIEGMDTEGAFTIVKAKVPHAELHQYGLALRSLTHGQARFSMKFDHYIPVSMDLQRKLIETYSKEASQVAEV